MALFDLNRSNDTPISTLKVAEIAPKNWHRYPSAITGAMLADSNPNEGKPRASTMADWSGGVKGDDTDTATATVALARGDGGANEPDYTPRTQQAKATAMGTTLAVDVARQRGYIAPNQRYPVAGDPAVVAPVVASISPTTAPATSLPLLCTITGTGFSPWSTVYTGGGLTPDPAAKYVDATHMTVPIWAAAPGTVSVAVEDHNVLSNTNVLFTVT